MTGLQKLLLLAYGIINVISLFLTIYDKRAAQTGRWRIPERRLMLWAALGGSAVMFLTMCLIHHKTRHPKFMIGIPLIFLVQCLLAMLLMPYLHI